MGLCKCLISKEKGFISKTAHGCELDGWDGVQAPLSF